MAASSPFTVRVEGLAEFMALVAESETMFETELAAGLLEIGQKVAVDTRSRYSSYSQAGAAGVKAKLSGGKIWTGGVIVAQTLSKSQTMSKRRLNFGGLMMKKAFLPAMDANQAATQAMADGLLASLVARWEL